MLRRSIADTFRAGIGKAGGVRAGVAGAGVFGGHHARKYAALEGVRLAAIYDPEAERALALAEPLGAEAFTDLNAFLAACDGVTVASPADSHAEIARAALAAGRHAYVEKPLATTSDEARALVEAARAGGLVLATGHQERVVFEAMGLLAVAERPIRIEAVRRGLPSPRNRDVSCVPDLMIHDLDLGLKLAGGWVGVSASGGYDEAVAEVDFGGGMSGRFETSRVAERRERTMRLVYASGVVEVDFLAPSFVNATPHPLNAAFAETAEGRDPLGTSVARFVAAVLGNGLAVAPGEEAAAALDLALAVERGL